ncbi:MAG: DNA-protecting protein DprA [Prevotella sp.]|nr:DNA-protecting protein DprA [Prevotella sp.]MBS7322313.1 DNA-protecting protein DprA [Bacteroidaceae bacterium]
MEQIIAINKNDEIFPASFRAIGKDCPESIYALGNLELLKSEHMVAIIGSRKATRTGNSKAYELGLNYAKKGYVVVSGLALGCDAAAHRGCMAGGGGTIAIVATGLDRVHPHENISLQEEILKKGGLILSEQPLGVKANPARLVARNRLQAALSEEVVVAECPVHSGTMHTVRYAQKYGKTIKAAILPYEKEENSGNKYIITSGLGTGI